MVFQGFSEPFHRDSKFHWSWRLLKDFANFRSFSGLSRVSVLWNGGRRLKCRFHVMLSSPLQQRFKFQNDAVTRRSYRRQDGSNVQDIARQHSLVNYTRLIWTVQIILKLNSSWRLADDGSTSCWRRVPRVALLRSDALTPLVKDRMYSWFS